MTPSIPAPWGPLVALFALFVLPVAVVVVPAVCDLRARRRQPWVR